jgi:AcrR family transcriptional regulator
MGSLTSAPVTEPRRRLPRAEREAQILDAATAAFGRRGYERTSMAAIAAEVGVTKPILYSHFGSKEGLFLACGVRAWTDMGLAIYTAATVPGPPDERLWRGIVAYFDFVDEHREVWRILYPQASGAEQRFAPRLRELQLGSIRMMAELFTAAADEEEVDPRLAAMAEPLAWGFVGAATSLALRWLRHPDEPKHLQAERLMNFAWKGFGDLLRGDVWRPPPAR